MSNFDGRPLYVGHLTGLRSFLVDADGQLRSRVMYEPFTTGENVARCGGPLASLTAFSRALTRVFGQTVAGAAMAPATGEPCVPGEHHVAGLRARCGFYAYTDSRAGDHHRPELGTVQAIIKGYGVMTTGTRGFRAEKAQLVAVVVPRRKRGWQSSGRVGWAGVALLNGAALAAGITVGRPSAIAILNAIFVVLGTFQLGRRVRRPERQRGYDRVASQYPGVPIYRTLATALAEHPLTAPPPANTTPPRTGARYVYYTQDETTGALPHDLTGLVRDRGATRSTYGGHDLGVHSPAPEGDRP
ncbi:hypothetical protein F9L07_28430 [Pimelobacter simplex]|uniref:Uncharacterized protein n=1 Tax=Nocardioides simplex TaxID=2045 RepID=A0A7J5DQJ9_NOCSI|nr:hypothetical protein [Pimelobacter simplex]KAB2806962.1 hypothetical protein F9L07_28430 [Pimelobacter simplex]